MGSYKGRDLIFARSFPFDKGFSPPDVLAFVRLPCSVPPFSLSLTDLRFDALQSSALMPLMPYKALLCTPPIGGQVDAPYMPPTGAMGNGKGRTNLRFDAPDAPYGGKGQWQRKGIRVHQGGGGKAFF